MKPHPRPPIIRKTIKWGGAAVTVLLVVVWVGSGWWYFEVGNSSGLSMRATHGQVSVGSSEAPLHADWIGAYWYSTPRANYRWSFSTSDNYFAENGMITVPIWLIILLAGGVSGYEWRREVLERRARLNLCPKCNYDRTGLDGGAAGAVCPECGAASSPS